MNHNQDHPFFRPLWRRLAIVAATLGWSAVEWANGQTTWGVLTLGLGIYSVWTFLLTYPKPPETET